MPRSHPPTLITLVRSTMAAHALAPRGTALLVAVSGGPDSMALLHVLAGLRSRGAFGLFAHGVDHGLRPEAAAELDLAAELARSLDVPFSRSHVAVRPGGNLQERARDARWTALREAAARHGVDRVATAHHADDRAETLLMRMLRGTGARGMAAMPARDGDRVRPMIAARRRDVEAHVARHKLPFATDPSNRNPRFLRTRVRYELVPVLERMSPRIVEHLCSLSDDCGRADRTDARPGGEPARSTTDTGGPRGQSRGERGPRFGAGATNRANQANQGR